MSHHPNDRSGPPQPVVIKDRVVVRDDSKRSAAIMLGVLLAVMLLGGVLLAVNAG